METTAVKRNYTGYGTQGKLYNEDLNTKDIALIVKRQLRNVFPRCTFSIKTSYDTIRLALMEAPFPVFEPIAEMDSEQLIACKEYNIQRSYASVNHYRITEAGDITEQAKKVLSYATSLLQSYNYNDSDAQRDYFDCNFYLTVSIGTFDRPFVQG